MGGQERGAEEKWREGLAQNLGAGTAAGAAGAGGIGT